MTDAEFEPQKKRIHELADKWLAPLGLLWWKVDIEYSRGTLKPNGEYSEGCAGFASVQWEYLQATLSFNLLKLATMTDDEVEYIFVHECCHILVHEMREWCQTDRLNSDASAMAMKHEERTVSCMAKAFIWTYKAGAGTLTSTRPEPIAVSPQTISSGA